MVSDDTNAFADAGFDAVETREPLLEVDAGVTEGRQDVVGDAALARLFDNALAREPGHAATGVTNDDDLSGVELVNGDEDAPHDAAEGMRDDRPGVLDHLDVAVAEAHGAGQELNQARIHARENDEPLIGKSVGKELFIFLAVDEGTVVVEDFGDGGHRGGTIAGGGGGGQMGVLGTLR